MKEKLLTQMVRQFQERHQRPPSRIYVDPLAAVVLVARRSVAPVWNGIPVEFREVDETVAPKKEANVLGVCLLDDGLRAVDISST